jgi:hypothetical protein
MSLQIFDCEQGTADWFACRAGIPTASEFATVMAKGKTAGAPSVTRRKYLMRLLGERLTGECEDSYSNAHMERGKVMEGEARDLYQFRTDAELTQVGFIRNAHFGAGCSPDSLIDANGMLEVKTKLPSIQLELLLSGGLPSEHKAQVQGQLWIAEREWVDFVSYWPRLPLHLVRVTRDEPYIATLAAEVARFNQELADLEGQFNKLREAA